MSAVVITKQHQEIRRPSNLANLAIRKKSKWQATLVFLVAFSCKGRGVCPSCNTRRMVETAAHLTDHVFPCLPVRKWVLSVPKRLRYYMHRDGATLGMVLRIFLRVIAQSLRASSAGAKAVSR